MCAMHTRTVDASIIASVYTTTTTVLTFLAANACQLLAIQFCSTTWSFWINVATALFQVWGSVYTQDCEGASGAFTDFGAKGDLVGLWTSCFHGRPVHQNTYAPHSTKVSSVPLTGWISQAKSWFLIGCHLARQTCNTRSGCLSKLFRSLAIIYLTDIYVGP